MAVSARLRRRLNRTARFFPADRHDPDTYPSIVMGGVAVFVYVDRSSTVRVSVHLDTTHRKLLRPQTRTVPLKVVIEDDAVFEG